MGIKKSIRKLMRLPSEMRFSEAKMVLEYFGFKLLRSKGSHFQFDVGDHVLTIVAHSGKIKRVYIVKIKNLIEDHLKTFYE
jgi:predicted RNA binding protein YcfA (HicA-like mRNA interferase family)